MTPRICQDHRPAEHDGVDTFRARDPFSRATEDDRVAPSPGGPAPVVAGTRIDLQDAALREAGAALTRALRALHDVEAHDLAAETLRLANRVLQARRALIRPVLTEAR
ncbi:MAG: hypothetical protein IT577_16080 [Verrucomicrobiae bacterium]|nr:hypothetical protein [Verrucomicrobiae bacterium]